MHADLAVVVIVPVVMTPFPVLSLLLTPGFRPFTVFASANNSSIDIGLQQALANVIGTPVMPQTVTCWFYASKNAGCNGISGTDAFATPALGRPL